MGKPVFRKILTLLATFFGIWIALRYLFPIFLPFLFGGALALAAEPAVQFLHTKLHLPRGGAAGIGVSLAFAILTLVLLSLCGLLLRELGRLAGVLPQAQQMVQTGLLSLRDWLLRLAGRAPENVGSLLTQTVLELFSGSSALLSKITDKLLGMATGLLGWIPDGALGFATGLISSFMISAKLPRLRTFVRQRIPEAWKNTCLPAIKTIRASTVCWFRAQAKLAGITFLIVGVGLFILRISFAPLWALVIALVDAVPLLGTGTVMLPWALVCLLQGDRIRCIGLLGVYAVAAITRSLLEPRLVGKQMGIDPLLTLISLYLGYRLWGFAGMLLAPLAAATAMQLSEMKTKPAE